MKKFFFAFMMSGLLLSSMCMAQQHNMNKGQYRHQEFNKNAQQNVVIFQYYMGKSGGADYPRLFDETLDAAEKGDADAQYHVGLMYSEGLGITRDYGKALEWFYKAAAKEHAMAQFSLGIMYANGRGVELNEMKAFEWYRKSAANGCALAQYNLGVIYYRGIIVPQDYAEALHWYTLAAKQNDAEAQLSPDEIVIVEEKAMEMRFQR